MIEFTDENFDKITKAMFKWIHKFNKKGVFFSGEYDKTLKEASILSGTGEDEIKDTLDRCPGTYLELQEQIQHIKSIINNAEPEEMYQEVSEEVSQEEPEELSLSRSILSGRNSNTRNILRKECIND